MAPDCTDARIAFWRTVWRHGRRHPSLHGWIHGVSDKMRSERPRQTGAE